MDLFYQFMYENVYSLIFMPIFIVMIIGSPKKLIRKIKSLLEYQETKSQFKIINIGQFFLFTLGIYHHYRFYFISKAIQEIFYNISIGKISNVDAVYIDDHLRKANLYERNSFMFYTYLVLFFIFESLCDTYSLLWKSNKLYRKIKILKKSSIEKEEKEKLIKKTTFNLIDEDQKLKEEANKIDSSLTKVLESIEELKELKNIRKNQEISSYNHLSKVYL